MKNMQKLFKGFVIGLGIFGLAGTAGAAEYKVNMCGASAQAGFWNGAGAAVMANAFSCASSAVDGVDDKNLIVRGLNCTAVPGGTGNDTVYMRYKAVSSSYGCGNYVCGNDSGYALPSSCSFTGGLTCTSTENANCQLGCADVDCDTLTAITVGWYKGRSGGAYGVYGNAGGYPITPTNTWKGVVVPFGFIVNNAVEHWVCTSPDQDNELPENAHMAYCKEDWQCDPDVNQSNTDPENPVFTPGVPGYNQWCRGDYKCYDSDQSGTGVCLDGNQDADYDLTITAPEKECTTAADCKIDLSMTRCDKRPLKNVSRLMALHIFSDQVQDWSEFGPSFPALPIVKCMRHGGSGTHQTLINTVFRGDAVVHSISRSTGPNFVWHYTSSSDLTRDCVAYYDGAIGYVDADKVMYRSKIAGSQEPNGGSLGIHQLMYQGIEPSRMAVAGGKYNFWAAQNCFADFTNCVTDPIEQDILTQLMTYAADPANLTFPIFGQRAYFWATQGEMNVTKANEFAYPVR